MDEVAGDFSQEDWLDPDSGEELSYNIYLPEDYDDTASYPLVVFIPDASLVGDDVTAALSQYGALIWASDTMQDETETIVVVPAYPEVILDDRDGYTMTPYVDMTGRFVTALKTEYAVDSERVYGTGQSMGAMTIMYLAAQNSDLFAAEMIVSGQWDLSELGGLASQTFVYTAAAGDERAATGQEEVEGLLTEVGVQYSSTTVDATWSAQRLNEAAAQLFIAGETANFLTFEKGTVLKASEESGDDARMGGEHMASFQPAYQIAELRNWLLEQSAE